jgi:hypothetical protein
MPSFECDTCADRYPHNMKFQDCPVCSDRCRRSKEDPTVPRDEADYRLIRQQRFIEFEQWCEENGRRPETSLPVYIELPEDIPPEGLDEAQRYAMGVAWMVEDHFPRYCIGELHVFWPDS